MSERTLAIRSERVDDVPLLLGLMMKLELPDLIDRSVVTEPNWTGLSVGWLTTIWLSYILTKCDHRMNQVRDWVNERVIMIERVTGRSLRETDFTDDRLAAVLRHLSNMTDWRKVETGLARLSIRVYDLPTKTVRLDSTVYQTNHESDKSELFAKGRTK